MDFSIYVNTVGFPKYSHMYGISQDEYDILVTTQVQGDDEC